MPFIPTTAADVLGIASTRTCVSDAFGSDSRNVAEGAGGRPQGFRRLLLPLQLSLAILVIRSSTITQGSPYYSCGYGHKLQYY